MTQKPAVKSARGYFQLHPKGFGFFVPTDTTQPDVFIPPHDTKGAFHRDEVTVEYWPEKGRGGRPSPKGTATTQPRWEGRIIKIHQRGTTRIVGRVEQGPTGCHVVPDDERLPRIVKIPPDGTGGARHGQTVAVVLHGYPEDKGGCWGKIIQILGKRGEFSTEIETVIHHHGLPTEFPDDVEAAARDLLETIDRSDTSDGRRDLRDIPFVTIDGETAKDFDDAVAVEDLGSGRYRIWVAIADVSAYVPLGSLVDHEALARGTSVYFPDRCLPMLPHALSDDACSLRPLEDRLVLVAEFEVNADGSRQRAKFYRGVINSRARLTYTIVHDLLTGNDATIHTQYATQQPMLVTMYAVCQCLRAVRFARGSLNLDLPEPEINLDIEGAPDNIFAAPRYESHQMIEELMVTANEEVAQYLTNRGYPCLFRIHPKPTEERIHAFQELLSHLGYPAKLHHPARPQDLSKVIEHVRGQPEERLVNHMLLRSMQQAFYSLENDGHFGLASRCYCHFTSPIRRYPDLVVHRLLIQAITRNQPHPDLKTLRDVAAHTSRRERVSMEAEREMLKVYAAAFLRDHIGETFDGVVTHITKHGFYVELLKYFVEGFVHQSTLTNDRYRFDAEHHQLVGKRKENRFSIGDKVQIRIHEISMEDREARFECLTINGHAL